MIYGIGNLIVGTVALMMGYSLAQDALGSKGMTSEWLDEIARKEHLQSILDELREKHKL